MADLYALSFSSWKRPALACCFPGQTIRHVQEVSQVPAGATLLVWGMKPWSGELARGVRVWRIEDGFLRSVGLGADLTQPLSWVIDAQGLYFDATRPSDLEILLNTAAFDAPLLSRAGALRQRIVQDRLTKYNVGKGSWQRPAGKQRVILVPGQVESDASIAYGAPGIRRNMDLLAAVRAAQPDAWLVYKPHPDVLAGLRARGENEAAALDWANEQISEVPMDVMLDAVDEVHCLTSLSGFEALLRQKPVTCYGQPFYSGWGLTHDVLPQPRRQRVLTLDQLVAGALICYPRYFNRPPRQLVTPEEALDELARWRAQHAGRQPWWREGMRMVLRRVVGVR